MVRERLAQRYQAAVCRARSPLRDLRVQADLVGLIVDYQDWRATQIRAMTRWSGFEDVDGASRPLSEQFS